MERLYDMDRGRKFALLGWVFALCAVVNVMFLEQRVLGMVYGLLGIFFFLVGGYEHYKVLTSKGGDSSGV